MVKLQTQAAMQVLIKELLYSTWLLQRHLNWCKIIYTSTWFYITKWMKDFNHDYNWSTLQPDNVQHIQLLVKCCYQQVESNTEL